MLCIVGVLGLALPAGAQDDLRRLPDGLVTRLGPVSAELIDPTERYAHGVLGDAIEAGGFAVTTGGKTHLYRLPPEAVFEDRRVRLADLDGDGRPEAIIVKSYLRQGAALAVYDIGPDGIAPRAESAAIGAPNRWLNPVGVGRFGDGAPLIAAVVTPHLSGSLRFYRLNGRHLAEVARIDGFTNHIIGSRDLDLGYVGAVGDDGLSAVILPTLDRRALAVVRLEGGQPRARIVARLPRPVVGVKPAGAQAATVMLDDGSAQTVALKP